MEVSLGSRSIGPLSASPDCPSGVAILACWGVTKSSMVGAGAHSGAVFCSSWVESAVAGARWRWNSRGRAVFVSAVDIEGAGGAKPENRELLCRGHIGGVEY